MALIDTFSRRTRHGAAAALAVLMPFFAAVAEAQNNGIAAKPEAAPVIMAEPAAKPLTFMQKKAITDDFIDKANQNPKRVNVMVWTSAQQEKGGATAEQLGKEITTYLDKMLQRPGAQAYPYPGNGDDTVTILVDNQMTTLRLSDIMGNPKVLDKVVNKGRDVMGPVAAKD